MYDKKKNERESERQKWQEANYVVAYSVAIFITLTGPSNQYVVVYTGVDEQ